MRDPASIRALFEQVGSDAPGVASGSVAFNALTEMTTSSGRWGFRAS